MKARKAKPGAAFHLVPIAVAVAGLLGLAGNAAAFNIPSDNPDIYMTLDNIVRYNIAQRMKDRDPGLSNNLAAADEGDFLYGKNDIVTNRIDLYSEFDFNYQKRMGFRVSGQAWYDVKYGDGSKARPDSTLAQQNIKGQFNDETRRYYHGPSAEFLDSFVWLNSKLDDTDLSVRLGRHSLIWGEGLIGSTQTVAYAQQPSDTRKSLQSPGASAKETALPVNQFTGTWQFQHNASLSWQRQFEWKPNRFSLGGTYYGADAFSPVINGVPNVPRVDAEEGEKGAWGLNLKWHPDFVDADLGLVYRKFSDTNPWAAQTNASVVTPGVNGRYVFATDIELWGVTAGTVINDIQFGAEISHRKNMALNSLGVSATSANNAGAAGRYEGAIGDTWHAVLNATFLFGNSSVWSSASLATELQYVGLDKITKNSQFYKASTNPSAQAAACKGGRDEVLNGCSSDDFLNFGLIFTPVWLQVYPGVDLSLQNTYVVGLKGIAPTNGGGSETSGQYKINLIADYHVKHKLELAYTAFLGKKRYGLAGSANPPTNSGGAAFPTKYTVGGGTFADRDTLGVTYTYNF